MSTKPLRPFLKWAGGKRWLFEKQLFSAPHYSGKYIEPFLGGGAVFFQLLPSFALLSDANGRLIELYTVIRDELLEFEAELKTHAALHCKDYYYAIRGKSFKKPVERAAQFMYLNRTCWNGLYRENQKGQFNVPIGTKLNVFLPSDNFTSWSKALSKTTLLHQDFELSIDTAMEGDFIFADPPYTVRHNMNGFVKYNQNIFAWEDQIRLCNALSRADERGVQFALTNADHESIRELYRGIGIQTQLTRHSRIAASSQHRSNSTEILISNTS
ncbi:Modification methylase DpnIIA [Pseudovibrio axinellae]|uniref:Site-specific DNA-methyltransferase (adenine-specific) n=1 Tax=Pseudovibrio axinellae TaxID=989403 RepID=A0A161VAP6_9HYPH|nr:Dam family site-specific DNA-(adenine-N6)-methyltransferase [Pseudovibrio axinellae]KZL21134.1 Modification methylase DpnIIA [Pseudovibrio axinellae]SEQ88861.1 DNA adenine methylase [Pseudovibrio axinellae]